MGVAASLSFDDNSEDGQQLRQALRKGDQAKALQLVRENPACLVAISPQERARIVHSAVKRGHGHVFQFIRDLPADPANPSSPGLAATSTTATQATSASPAASPSRPRVASPSSPIIPSSQAQLSLAASFSQGPHPAGPRRAGAAAPGFASPSAPPESSSDQPSDRGTSASPSRAQTPASPHGRHHHHHLSLPHPHLHHHHHNSQMTRGSWLNAADRRGRTPLMTGVLYNRLECVEGLVSLGADPWVGDRRGRTTALHLAAWLGHSPLVSALLKSAVPGPDTGRSLVDVQDMYGFTPLHYAAAAGHADVASTLLDATASYIAASHLPYDPSRSPLLTPDSAPGGGGSAAAKVRVSAAAGIRRRLSNLSGGVRVGGRSLGGGAGGGAGGRLPPCAPRSNPLHLAALRGDGAVASLIVQRYLVDTEGLSRAARDRVPDPRRQLNKDGFQPYMLAGNLGHWHVAQMLIPHSRDNQLLTRNRDFLIFFPLPDPDAVAAGGSFGGGGGTAARGPPSLTELASRAWADKLLADVKAAEATIRQRQAAAASPLAVAAGSGGGAGAGTSAAATAAALSLGAAGRDSNHGGRACCSGGGGGGGGGGGPFGALLRRSGKAAWVAAALGGGSGAGAAAVAAATALISGALGKTASGRGPSGLGGGVAAGGGAGSGGGGTASAALASLDPSGGGGGGLLGGSPEDSNQGSCVNTPRSSVCGGGADLVQARASTVQGASGRLTYSLTLTSAAPAAPASALWPDSTSSRRGTSLDMGRLPSGPLSSGTAAAGAAAGGPLYGSGGAPSTSLVRCPPSQLSPGGTAAATAAALRAAPHSPMHAPSSGVAAGAVGSGLFRFPPTPHSPSGPGCSGGGGGGLFRFPPSPQLSQSSSNLTPLCDVCFEQPQELALRPCPHRLCASCCRRVVEMHCAIGAGGGAAGAGAGGMPPGRRAAAVPPRCPFCQATIRGFAPAPTAVLMGGAGVSARPSQQQLQHVIS